ncbi:NAD(P)-dependent oxidoreductase [Xanthobacter sp. VTT E-85237]
MPSTRLTFAYIGVGLMGGPMAARLVARGHEVHAYDVSADRLAEAVAAGARPALDPADAVAGANAVLLNLPTPAAVEQAVFGPDGVAQVMRPPQVLVDFSTIEVERCRAFAARLAAQTGCAWIDAPVSGGPPASAEGKLAVMAGGPKDEIERLAPLFADISSAFTHVGPTGAGLTAKMVSQLMVSCLYVVLAEGAKLAEQAGIDVARVPACVSGGHADGELLRQIFPRFAERDFRPRAYTRQLVKDMHMVKELADAAGAPTPMMDEALRLYDRYVALGGSERDTSAILELYDHDAQPRHAQP